ncbi:MAG: hypothetical protein FWG50_09070 [Kiritimatiellaeota bacterium]|nr:hypothetical protein [Kiritimatiellota bacterium]
MERAPQKPRPPRVRQVPAGLTAGKGNRKARRGIREIEASGSAGLPPCLSFGKAEALRSRHNAATDYVRSNQTVMTYSDLQGINGKLFLEAINPSQNWSDIRIVVSLSVDGGSTWVCSNAVRVTSMRCNFTVGVVRQFYIDSGNGNRHLFAPDHSTPLSLMTSTERYLESLKAIGKNEELGKGWDIGNKWWHDGDATLGHGFAFFQYEGPGLGAGLSSACDTSALDHKVYVGKTGGGNLWWYGGGTSNTQEELAWWDICPHKIENKFLVLKQSYTLHPERMSALYSTFVSPDRFALFGLHIDENVNGWGCLSHVGLSMVAHNLDVDKINGCLFDKGVPSTANKSAWAVIRGVYSSIPDPADQEGKVGYRIVKDGIDVLKSFNSSRGWEEYVDESSTTFRQLRRALYRKYRGKTMLTDSGEILIDSPASLPLNDSVDNLRFYDPGRFPRIFGELPENVFDVKAN